MAVMPSAHIQAGLALAALCLLPLGCYAELDPIECFSDGDISGAETTLCCDPNDDSGGFVACRARLRDKPELTAVAELALCLPEGRCAVDCRPDENCACTQSGACGGTCTDQQGAAVGCGCTTIEDIPTACARQGLRASSLCAVCRECRSDVDCVGLPQGPLCLQGAVCGCSQDSDCAEGLCTEGSCIGAP